MTNDINSTPPVVHSEESDYMKFRGKCKEFCDAAIAADPSLKLVRGHYYCPLWCSKEQHWWTRRPDGTIFDPTKDQFPSKGNGFYIEFDGICHCANCGKSIKEDDALFHGRYSFCSDICIYGFVM